MSIGFKKKQVITLLVLSLIMGQANMLYAKKNSEEPNYIKFHNYSEQVSNNNFVDSISVKKLHLLFKPTKSCEIKIQYPQLVDNKKPYSVKGINQEIKKFFGINNYLNADFRSDLCPADIYNIYKLKQNKLFINISNSVVTFLEGAQHSTKYTTTIIIDKKTGQLIKNKDFFKENLTDSLKSFLLNKIRLVYNSYKIPNFNMDYYAEELDDYNFFIDGKTVVFYMKDDKEDFMGELEVPVQYTDINKFIKNEYK
jgi:hypothetical protein